MIRELKIENKESAALFILSSGNLSVFVTNGQNKDYFFAFPVHRVPQIRDFFATWSPAPKTLTFEDKGITLSLHRDETRMFLRVVSKERTFDVNLIFNKSYLINFLEGIKKNG